MKSKKADALLSEKSYASCAWLSAIMLVLSLFCLFTAGEMVIYYLVAAALAIVPLAASQTRISRIAGLGLVIIAMVAAGVDHQKGMNLWQSRWQAAVSQLAQFRNKPAIAPTTLP
jgi:hypothetical protein